MYLLIALKKHLLFSKKKVQTFFSQYFLSCVLITYLLSIKLLTIVTYICHFSTNKKSNFTMVYLQGEEVLRCLPYSHIVLQEVQNLVCDFCLRFKPNNNDCSYQRCSRCKLVYYCSVSCQKKGWFNHNYSISFFQKRKIWYLYLFCFG